MLCLKLVSVVTFIRKWNMHSNFLTVESFLQNLPLNEWHSCHTGKFLLTCSVFSAGDVRRANGLLARYRSALHGSGHSILMYNLLMKVLCWILPLQLGFVRQHTRRIHGKFYFSDPSKLWRRRPLQLQGLLCCENNNF